MVTVRSRLFDRAAEDGMTLIEMVISITLLGIIVGPITAMFLLGFLSSNGTRDQIADSVSAQLVSSWLVKDIQSAAAVTTSGGDCGKPGDVRLHLEMPDSPGATTVQYLSRPGTDGQLELHRVSCGGSSAPTESLVVHYLADDSDAVQVVCTRQDGTPLACDGSPAIRTVKVDMLAKRANPQATAYYTPLRFSFQASRRAS